ncbi:XRE family transcriptional regulator [Sphingomonas sp.]|uniref:XRE family transcriptional regulator n=1 Tax=Sphingomonas sp. TaxID=28214 RepID=UPI0031DF2392
MSDSIFPNRRLADHLKSLRTDRALSLQDLAASSGVSRATLSRIENGEVSPAAETLGRLASAYAMPLSRLLAPLEPGFPALIRREAQSLWRDAGKGFVRRALSPPNGQLGLEMIECTIDPHQHIAYERPAFPGHEHHLALLEGALGLTVDGTRYDLLPGDCLRYRLQGASLFETAEQPARYIIAMA